MSGRFGNAIDNFLIIMVAVAIVLLLVVMLGARQSPFRQKISRMLVPSASRWNLTGSTILQEKEICESQTAEKIRLVRSLQFWCRR